jgi:beta-lactamase regulating signal transducer with metallopeptidase domain
MPPVLLLLLLLLRRILHERAFACYHSGCWFTTFDLQLSSIIPSIQTLVAFQTSQAKAILHPSCA